MDYARDRDHISTDDVHAVLIRTKKDPVYELTGALSERDMLKTIYYMASLLSSGFHYLQILAALTNQIRKLLMIKDFQESRYGRDWNPGIGYDQFKQIIVPLIVKYDEKLIEKTIYHQGAMKGKFGQANDSKKKPVSDLMIAKNPNNPYPVFQQFLRSRNYSKKELLSAFVALSHADIKLKTTGQKPVTVLEEVIFSICGQPNPAH